MRDSNAIRGGEQLKALTDPFFMAPLLLRAYCFSIKVQFTFQRLAGLMFCARFSSHL